MLLIDNTASHLVENGRCHTRAENETSSGSEEILRPISLTPCISKVGEGFIVDDYLKPAVLDVIDSSQYGPEIVKYFGFDKHDGYMVSED